MLEYLLIDCGMSRLVLKGFVVKTHGGSKSKKIGYRFRDKSLLKQAFTHSLYANGQRKE